MHNTLQPSFRAEQEQSEIFDCIWYIVRTLPGELYQDDPLKQFSDSGGDTQAVLSPELSRCASMVPVAFHSKIK